MKLYRLSFETNENCDIEYTTVIGTEVIKAMWGHKGTVVTYDGCCDNGDSVFSLACQGTTIRVICHELPESTMLVIPAE